MAELGEKRADLIEHLAELRTRLVRMIIYLVIGTSATWFLYDRLFAILTRPMVQVLAKCHSKFLYTSFTEPFMIQMQTCMVAGLIVVSPLVTWELWGFVSPGLTPNEKRPLRWVAPLAAVLFACGVTLCYLIMPAAFNWFVSYVNPNAELRPSVQQSLLFAVKFLLAFGVAFELPVLLMLLAKVGIVNSRMLKEHWRYSIVGVSVAAAVLTPSNDAFSMLCMAIPMAGLYLASIYLVALVEDQRTPVTAVRDWFGRILRGKRRK